MNRPNTLLTITRRCQQLRLPNRSQACTVAWKFSTQRTYCKATDYPTERRWWPYKVDVGVVYHAVKKNRIRRKLEQISTPPGQAPPRNRPTVVNVPAVFRTVCIDTAAEEPEEVREKMPTILCIHGSGGSHEDFIPLVKNLVNEHGFRAVCLNWPGYGKTRGLARRDDALFQFRSEETINFLLSFLQEINLKRLDIVLGHSIGCAAASYICARGEQPSSLVMIAPVPDKPYKGVQPIKLLKTLSTLWQVKVLRPFVQYFIQLGYLRRGFRIKDPIHAVNATLMGAGVNFGLIERLAMELEMKKMPKLFVYGGKDNVIEPNIQKEFAPKVGVKQECFDVYNEDIELVIEGASSNGVYLKGILFEEGGHAPHLKDAYIPILTKEILALYNSTTGKCS